MTNLAFPPLPAHRGGYDDLAEQILLKLIAEFDLRRAWSGGGTVRSCAHWLNWQCGIAMGAVRKKVRTMTRVATPENEDYLLYIVGHYP